MKKLTIILISFTLCVQIDAQNGTGLVFLDEEEYRDIQLATTSMMGTLPSHRDLSNWFPTPGNQGNQSSCVGWAVAYGLKSYQEAIERKHAPSSNNQIYSPSFIYNQIKLHNCEGGSHITDALNMLKMKGVATLQSFPYSEFDCSTTPSLSVISRAKDFIIADWRRVNIQDDVEIKSQLNAGFPIVIGMRIDDGFIKLGYNQVYRGASGMEKGGHAMVVVGFDDSKSAYKVLNSWGTSWGTGGYGWISYSAFKNRVKEAYTAQDIVINNPDVIIDRPDNNNNNNQNIDIPPPISPDAISVSAFLGQPIVNHSQMVQTPIGLQPGMIISIPGSIMNGIGSYAQIVLRFYMPNGQPLFANVNEGVYRDAHGLVATGTQRGQIINNPASLGNHIVSIPYYALNFQPTRGMNIYNIAVQATLYINEFEKSKSTLTPMIIRY